LIYQTNNGAVSTGAGKCLAKQKQHSPNKAFIMAQHFVLFENSKTFFLFSLFFPPLELLLQVTGRRENLGMRLGCLWWNRQFQTLKASGSALVRYPFS